MRRAAEIPYPAELMQDGWIANPNRMGDFLRQSLRENRLGAGRLAFLVPGDLAYVQTATMPVMNARQLKMNLRFVFADYITDNLDRYSFDYAMLSTVKEIRAALAAPPPDENAEEETAGPTMDFLAVAAPTAMMGQVWKTAERAKMRLAKACPPECACLGLIRADLERSGNYEREYCFLDLGSRAVRMYMFKGERHMATRALEANLRGVDVPVAHALRVRQEEARPLFRENRGNCQRLPACLEVYDNIATELMRTLNFYRFSHQDSVLEDIWLLGGGASVAPLAETLEAALDMRLHKAVELVPGGSGIDQCGTFALAVGAALN